MYLALKLKSRSRDKKVPAWKRFVPAERSSSVTPNALDLPLLLLKAKTQIARKDLFAAHLYLFGQLNQKDVSEFMRSNVEYRKTSQSTVSMAIRRLEKLLEFAKNSGEFVVEKQLLDMFKERQKRKSKTVTIIAQGSLQGKAANPNDNERIDEKLDEEFKKAKINNGTCKLL